jgi:hypothetical protein
MRSSAVLVSLAFAGLANGAYTNVALDAPVSLVAGSASGAALSTLTDGVFRPRGTQWQSGTVWWNGTTTTFEIELGRVWNIVGAIVQADDNDAYRLLYRDMDTGLFEVLWDVPNYDGFGNGMQTRPNPANNAEIHFFTGPVATDALRIAAVSGDSANSLSEVQVFIPAPGAAAALGLALIVARRRR